MKSLMLFLLFLLLFSCSEKQSAGNSMETENSIALFLRDEKGEPLLNAELSILPHWFVASRDSNVALVYHTDESGRVLLDDLALGKYQIALKRGLEGSVYNFDHLGENQELNLRLVDLLEYRGFVPDSLRGQGGEVSVFGTPYRAQVDEEGFFTLKDIPESTQLRLHFLPQNGGAPIEKEFVVTKENEKVDTLATSDLTLADRLFWPQSLTLNSADFISPWMRFEAFPTLLKINLNETNVVFDDFPAEGADLVLLNALGEEFEHHVDFWNSDLKVAQLNVKVRSQEDLAGEWTLLWGRPYFYSYDSTKVYESLEESSYHFLNSVLIDAFEESSSLADFPEGVDSSYWFIVGSENSTHTPLNSGELYQGIEEAGLGRTGKALHITYEANEPEWVLVGVELGKGFNQLSALDSLVFYARGEGSYSVSFENNTVDKTKKAWLHGMLSPEWERYVVRPRDLDPPEEMQQNVGWEGVKDSVNIINFFANNGTEIWIDDVVLYGVNRDDFTKNP